MPKESKLTKSFVEINECNVCSRFLCCLNSFLNPQLKFHSSGFQRLKVDDEPK